VVIVPIYKNDEEKSQVMPAVAQVERALQVFRVKVDAREEFTPGYKYNHWELRGVPLRIEIGPKDVAKGTVAFARRDIPGREGKCFVPNSQLDGQVAELLQTIQASLYDRALRFRRENTYDPLTLADLYDIVQKGWAQSWWCGSPDCESKIKVDTKATTRCIPFDQPDGEGTCIVCGAPAKEKVIFGRSY
jgi:prolyl-tRNA synthetase